MPVLNKLIRRLRQLNKVNIQKWGKPMKIIAVIVAAGRGTRAGGTTPKQWQHLSSKRIIDHSIDLFKNNSRIDKVMVVLHSDDLDLLNRKDVYLQKVVPQDQNRLNTGLELYDKLRDLIMY